MAREISLEGFRMLKDEGKKERGARGETSGRREGEMLFSCGEVESFNQAA